MSTKVLVIDDSESIRFHLRTILEQVGCDVEVANDGNQGLAALQTGNFDCVLCDFNMPEMDGLKLLETVKAEQRHMSLPILMLSTVGSRDVIYQAKLAGAAGWIVKPYNENQVVSAIERVTKSRSHRCEQLSQ